MTGAAPEVLSGAPGRIAGVSDAELDVIRSAFAKWRVKEPRNRLRSVYYDGKMPVRDLGISTPPQVKQRIKAVLGWPAKACTMLAERSVFDRFVSADGTEDPFEIEAILDANRFDTELPQAITSAYKHACSFITVAKGDTASAEPDVLLQARSAEWVGALWDKRRRVVSAMLAVVDVDREGLPSAFDVYLPHTVLLCTRTAAGGWKADRRPNPLGMVLAEPLTYDAQLDRPFGRSRISRAVMSITDNTLRTILRTEISAEFYTAPRMAAIGIAEDAFQNGKWAATLDRWFALTRDEDGQVPDVKQFPQMTMQPLMDLYRSYASQLQGETGIPISSLGIVTDNPPSAEAMYAATFDLINAARIANRSHGAALRRVAQKIIAVRDGADAVTDEARKIQANWVNPAFTSPTASADALVKLASVFPWMAESETALEFAGFTGPEITRLMADKRRTQSGSVLDRVLAARQAPAATQPREVAEPEALS